MQSLIYHSNKMFNFKLQTSTITCYEIFQIYLYDMPAHLKNGQVWLLILLLNFGPFLVRIKHSLSNLKINPSLTRPNYPHYLFRNYPHFGRFRIPLRDPQPRFTRYVCPNTRFNDERNFKNRILIIKNLRSSFENTW